MDHRLPGLEPVNDPRLTREQRLTALANLVRESAGVLDGPVLGTGEVNNHIHTVYSFSPYTPSMAALRARESGLEVAGSVDHDSIGAAEEMADACAVLGMGSVTGFELRVSFRDTPFARKKLNNPDSIGIAYMTVQGVPRSRIPQVKEFLAPVNKRRNKRNRLMAGETSRLLQEAGLGSLDFETEIRPLSKADEGGSVTERHLLAAVSNKLILKFGKGPALVEGLQSTLKVAVPSKIASYLSDQDNPHYLFDLLGVLKSGFLDRVYVQPDEAECLPVRQVTAFAHSIGAVPAYAYLGDVGESPTGDKKAEKFEDDFLDDLMKELAGLGYQAVAYMPPRNTLAQLKRLQSLCARYGLMEISGVDINSSRQSFHCPEVLHDDFKHLIDTTWALVAHEKFASLDASLGLFSPKDPLVRLPLPQRIAAYARLGKKLDLRHPEKASLLVRELINPETKRSPS